MTLPVPLRLAGDALKRLQCLWDSGTRRPADLRQCLMFKYPASSGDQCRQRLVVGFDPLRNACPREFVIVRHGLKIRGEGLASKDGDVIDILCGQGRIVEGQDRPDVELVRSGMIFAEIARIRVDLIDVALLGVLPPFELDHMRRRPRQEDNVRPPPAFPW